MIPRLVRDPCNEAGAAFDGLLLLLIDIDGFVVAVADKMITIMMMINVSAGNGADDDDDE
jgi:hypothetical protein